MDSSVYRILYCSRNLIEGTDGQRDKEIANILATARANNSKQEVTGALLFNAGYFAQVLEGPRTHIEKVFEQIQRDPRHTDVTVLENGKAELRDFPNWSMAHVEPPSGEQATGIAATLHEALLHPDNNGDEVLGLLRNLVLRED